MSIIATLLDIVKHEMKRPPPSWFETQLTSKEKKELQRECQGASAFDPKNTREEMMKQFLEGNLVECTKECEYGRITVILTDTTTKEDIPWELWGRILRMYGGQTPYRVYVFAHPRRREFPRMGQPIEPEHINGGYTYPCQKNMIMIYRGEDATRVLIHELQHASCLDHAHHSVDQQEAETEAWAELIYIALLSEGAPSRFRVLHEQQSQWMCSQNHKVKRYIGETQEFPWRYTVGKQEVWERWGILLPCKPSSLRIQSLRLTVPPSPVFTRRWGVRETSTLL